MVLELDTPFDVSLDGEVLAAVQLAFDDNRLANIHNVPLDPPGIRLHRRRCAYRLSGCGCCRRRRLAARRSHRFITLPHLVPPPRWAHPGRWPAASTKAGPGHVTHRDTPRRGGCHGLLTCLTRLCR